MTVSLPSTRASSVVVSTTYAEVAPAGIVTVPGRAAWSVSAAGPDRAYRTVSAELVGPVRLTWHRPVSVPGSALQGSYALTVTTGSSLSSSVTVPLTVVPSLYVASGATVSTTVSLP